MVLEEKTLDLLALLTAHVGGDTLMVPIVPRPPTPAPLHTPAIDAPEKKRKRGKWSEGFEEGEIPKSTQQPSTKELRVTRAQQKKGATTRLGKSTDGKQRSKATIWNLAFVLSLGDPVTSEASLRDA